MADTIKITKEMIQEVANMATIRPNRLHVMPWDNKWRVKKSRSSKAMGIYTTEEEAMKVAEDEVYTGRVDCAVIHDKHLLVVKVINK